MKIKPNVNNHLLPSDSRLWSVPNSVAHAKDALFKSTYMDPEKRLTMRRKVFKKFPSLGKANAMAQALKGY